jgi:beta-glucosidase
MRISKAMAMQMALALVCLNASAPGFAQQAGYTAGQGASPWMDKTLSPDRRANLLLKEMTLDEKISMIHGAGWEHNIWADEHATQAAMEMTPGAAGYLQGVKRLGIPAIQMADAAVGVTKGAATGRFSTPLPSGLAEASAWSRALSHESGALIGRELLSAGFNMSLGGGCNLLREPRNGRNFEYKGEDPILAGTLVGEQIRGVQEQGVIGDIKHYALNDQETARTTLNAVMDRRAMRETDLLAFEIGIRIGHPGAVMCSYNKVNGVYACENPYLLNDVLKKDFGFEGFVVSDWKATHSIGAALQGLDVEMPDDSHFGQKLKDAVLHGELPAARLDDMVRRVLRSEIAAGVFDRVPTQSVTDVTYGLKFAQHAAEQGTVLLKNDRGVLPLHVGGIRSIVLIGGHADAGVLSGGGSAQVDPPGGNAIAETGRRAIVYYRSSPLTALRRQLQGIAVSYVDGEDPGQAAAAAKHADIAIVFAVQPAREDTDLADLSLPGKQDALIDAVADANAKTIVVLETGGPVKMPWLQKVASVLEIWYPGIRGGEALANILLGQVNPSGKLPVTFPMDEQQLPRPVLTSRAEHAPVVEYSEGLKIGYKWYDATGKRPLFPFGFGLSYTQFSYSRLDVGADPFTLHFTVRNTGSFAGTEISEVYASLPPEAAEPPKRLVGWARTQLGPGESKQVEVKLDPFSFMIFDATLDRWVTVGGTYHVQVGGSSVDTPLVATIILKAR